jgi:hypothetical protein
MPRLSLRRSWRIAIGADATIFDLNATATRPAFYRRHVAALALAYAGPQASTAAPHVRICRKRFLHQQSARIERVHVMVGGASTAALAQMAKSVLDAARCCGSSSALMMVT